MVCVAFKGMAVSNDCSRCAVLHCSTCDYDRHGLPAASPPRAGARSAEGLYTDLKWIRRKFRSRQLKEMFSPGGGLPRVGQTGCSWPGWD
jgi:hypothetical protein